MDTVHTAAPARRSLVLAAVCLAALAINLDTTIVNVALPSLARELPAGTRVLQWVVDGYNLAFAGLVLAAGSVSDRWGRRPALITGLLGFAVANLLGALAGGPTTLVAARIAAGACAALIYPTTLSVISNTFPDRRERAAAIGVWGAVTGVGVALGPVTGGLLLEHSSWRSVFVALVPLSLAGAAAAYALVPESRDPQVPALDRRGLVVSVATLTLLVWTVIEAPRLGWGSPRTVVGLVGAALLAAVFVLVERGEEHPMLDVSLFKVPAFSAASGAVTVAFFALFGFIFLVTQYFQVIRGYGTLSTGVRILPVAGSIAVSSVVGAQLAPRVGTRAVVVTGLALFGASFAWIAATGVSTPYAVIAVQMVIMGTGLGLTSAPATESILTVLPPARAGVGSAVNDATRELGGTLGVAVVGSVFASLYGSSLASGAASVLGPQARESVVAALQAAGGRPELASAVQSAFMSGFHAGCLVAAAVCWAGAVGAALALPRRTASGPVLSVPAPATSAAAVG